MRTLTKEQIIDDILKSDAKYVKTMISPEACAIDIAIRDIEDSELSLHDFWWEDSATGLDEEDY